MNLTIYKVAVQMESQQQCNRMKQLCIEYGLPIWDDSCAFEFEPELFDCFRCVFDEFFIACVDEDFTLITESEFIELLKQTE